MPEETLRIRVKDWSSFQHYKHRNPIWIKLYRSLLDEMPFQRLPLASRALAPMLWLLASEYEDGVIVASREEIAFKLRAPLEEINAGLNPLLSSKYFECEQDASNALAERNQPATTEKRRVEKEREGESESAAQLLDYSFSDPNFDGQEWCDKIIYAWPLADHSQACKVAIYEAIEDEVRENHIPRLQASQNVLQRVSAIGEVIKGEYPKAEWKFYPLLKVMQQRSYRRDLETWRNPRTAARASYSDGY